MDIRKIIILALSAALPFQSIFAQQLENKLYNAIIKNSPNDVQKTLNEEVIDSSRVTPIIYKIDLKSTSLSGHSFLHDALENFIKYTKKPMKLNIVETAIKTAASISSTTYAVLVAWLIKNYKFPNESKAPLHLLVATAFLFAAASSVGALKSGSKAINIKHNIDNAWKIVELINNKMAEQGLLADAESEDLMKQLTPQFQEILKKQK